jgi:hypothetical protein
MLLARAAAAVAPSGQSCGDGLSQRDNPAPAHTDKQPNTRQDHPCLRRRSPHVDAQHLHGAITEIVARNRGILSCGRAGAAVPTLTDRRNNEDGTSNPATVILDGLPETRAWQEDLYRDIHQHPELSHQEHALPA